MKKYFTFILVLLLSCAGFSQQINIKNNPPIYIAFLWHMHQPIYWPYESIIQTEQNNRYPFSVFDIHNQRTGPYTSWPKNAVQKGISANMLHFGAQVSFSGSLIENLNNLESNGNQNFSNWKSSWNSIKTLQTYLGNPRLDMVAFGYHHPLMGLIDEIDIRKQIQAHKQIMSQNFSGSYSKGIFPPENAFTPKMIPALVAEGIDWVLIDNAHFERAAENYPFNTGGNLYEANKSDVQNPDPNDWVQLNGLWAPTKVSTQWAHQPHFVEYVDPETGQKTKMIAVPSSRYLGNEDGRGGFGALNYENVMSQFESDNSDPNHPTLIVLAHDGDNYGGGSESYYNSNFQSFVNWLQANNSRFICTTIQDYLEMFPPAVDDIIHVEDGSWSGADNGDPEFKKWNADPGSDGYSADRNSWGVITAAKNIMLTANQINPSNPAVQNAWKFMLNAEASDYWYWDYSLNGIWDSHPTRGSNLTTQEVMSIVQGGNDVTGPTIYSPQREPYNPGGTEWGIAQPSNFKVWSYVYDYSGLAYVKLKYRTDNDGVNPISSIENETFTGGSDVSAWNEIDMTGLYINPQTNPLPSYKAEEFSAEITGINNKLLDYYIEAKDNNNNVSKSQIKHVWVGENNGGTGSGGITWFPQQPTINDSITIIISGAAQGAKLHWGVNNQGSSWQTPNQAYWTTGTTLFNGTGPAVESPFNGPLNDTLKIKIGPFNKPDQLIEEVAFVIHYNDDTWNNNNGQDFQINFGGGSQTFTIDGQLDASAGLAVSNAGAELYLAWNGSELYLATQSAQSVGKDVFILLADSLRTQQSAPWAKAGTTVGWSAFLANESTNNYNSWFDASGSTQNAAGSYLEGTVNVQSEFGYIPSKLYIAVGRYATNDGGELTTQVPSGNGDSNIDADEFFEFDYSITSIEDKSFIRKDFQLLSNYPNPFNPSTKIKYSIPEGGRVVVKIFDILGKEVITLTDEYKDAGYYEVEFNAGNLSSGVYFYKIVSGRYSEIKKMVLLR